METAPTETKLSGPKSLEWFRWKWWNRFLVFLHFLYVSIPSSSGSCWVSMVAISFWLWLWLWVSMTVFVPSVLMVDFHCGARLCSFPQKPNYSLNGPNQSCKQREGKLEKALLQQLHNLHFSKQGLSKRRNQQCTHKSSFKSTTS